MGLIVLLQDKLPKAEVVMEAAKVHPFVTQK